MTKAEILARMRDEPGRWDDLLKQIPREKMFAPVIYDGWTIKDTIGHLAYYEGWLLNWLEAACHGNVKVATLQDLLSVDERNALVWAANKDRDLDELILESRQMADRLYQMVKTLPERELLKAHAFDRYILPFWGDTRPLWRCIASDSFEHYREHTLAVQAWWDSMKSPVRSATSDLQTAR